MVHAFFARRWVEQIDGSCSNLAVILGPDAESMHDTQCFYLPEVSLFRPLGIETSLMVVFLIKDFNCQPRRLLARAEQRFSECKRARTLIPAHSRESTFALRASYFHRSTWTLEAHSSMYMSNAICVNYFSRVSLYG